MTSENSGVAFEDNGRGLVFTVQGVASGDYLLERSRQAYSPESVGELRYQIVDLRDLVRLDMSTAQMQELAELDRRLAQQLAAGAPLRVALVVSHELTEGLARIYCAYANSAELEARIFSELETARAWARQSLETDNNTRLCS